MKTETLTKRELQIAELIAWGASKKEVADRLFISEYTVDNHLRKVYEKTKVNKANELSAWWFCTRFHISFDLSPLKRSLIAGVLLLCLLPRELCTSQDTIRNKRSNRVSQRLYRAKRRNDNTLNLDCYAF